jgi:hypothetical protein
MSVFIGEEVLDAFRVWERRERRTARRGASFCCIAVLRSLLFLPVQLVQLFSRGGVVGMGGDSKYRILSSIGGGVVEPVA